MPRNGSGVYTLPAGNPVTSNTVIATSWANPTMSDIADEITNSLDRNGRGGMLAPFKVSDGTISLPGLAWANEPGLGLWREATAIAHFANTGSNIVSYYSDRAEFPLTAAPKNIRPRNGTTAIVTGAALDWNGSYSLLASPGDVIDGHSNLVQGQMKRIIVTGPGSITINGAPGATFGWATNSPQWGLYKTVITLVALTTTEISGVTTPIDTAPV